MLAVSLNIISGFCGQIQSGPWRVLWRRRLYRRVVRVPPVIRCRWRCLPGALSAGVLGFIVGFASVRVRSDFLAVTTIGISFLFVGFVRKQDWLGARWASAESRQVRPWPGTGNAMIIEFSQLARSHSAFTQPELDGLRIPRRRR